MPKTPYILVADSSNARIYKSDARLTALELVHEEANPEGRLMRSELDSDRPGMQRKGVGGTHSYGGDSDSTRHESFAFARALAKLLHGEHLAGKFTDLMIVAPPEFLGDLRQNLSQDCKNVLGKTVNKNLLREDERSLVAHLV